MNPKALSSQHLRTPENTREALLDAMEQDTRPCRQCGGPDAQAIAARIWERAIAVVENLAHEYDSPESEDALRDVLAALKAAQTQEPS